jgi:hypothetical protein
LGGTDIESPREEESSVRFLVVDTEAMEDSGFMGVVARNLSFEGALIGVLLNRTDDFLDGQVRGAPPLTPKTPRK